MTCCSVTKVLRKPLGLHVSHIYIYKETIYIVFLGENNFIVQLIYMHMRSVNSPKILLMLRKMVKDGRSSAFHLLCAPKGIDAGFWQRR